MSGPALFSEQFSVHSGPFYLRLLSLCSEVRRKRLTLGLFREIEREEVRNSAIGLS